MKLLQSKIFVFIFSFALGGGDIYFSNGYAQAKDILNNRKEPFHGVESSHVHTLVSDPFSRMEKIHKQMRKRFDESYNNIFSDDFFSKDIFNFNWENKLLSKEIQVQEFEDDEYKYIELYIEGMAENTIDISISNGIVSISGEMGENKSDHSLNYRSMSSYISRFSRSFNVPENVKEGDAKIDTDENKVIIKFPKIRT